MKISRVSGVRVSASGATSYVIQFRMGERESSTRRYTIETNGSPSPPATAREEAVRLLILVARGIDPMEEDKKRRQEAVDLAFSKYADTFSAACKGRGGGGEKTLVNRSIRLHLKPVLGNKPLPTIT